MQPVPFFTNWLFVERQLKSDSYHKDTKNTKGSRPNALNLTCDLIHARIATCFPLPVASLPFDSIGLPSPGDEKSRMKSQSVFEIHMLLYIAKLET